MGVVTFRSRIAGLIICKIHFRLVTSKEPVVLLSRTNLFRSNFLSSIAKHEEHRVDNIRFTGPIRADNGCKSLRNLVKDKLFPIKSDLVKWTDHFSPSVAFKVFVDNLFDHKPWLPLFPDSDGSRGIRDGKLRGSNELFKSIPTVGGFFLISHCLKKKKKVYKEV